MSKTNFTPGKWVADIRCGCCAVYPDASRDDWEQGLYNDDENIYYKSYPNVATNPELAFRSEEKIANAHLIKTAPKLYAMLDKIATTPVCAIHVAKDIKKLLAEARGE